tara:strand:+ start:6047 stop:6250 length:204 start_codon:yes stop_codon:yes gene_type:complete
MSARFIDWLVEGSCHEDSTGPMSFDATRLEGQCVRCMEALEKQVVDVYMIKLRVISVLVLNPSYPHS